MLIKKIILISFLISSLIAEDLNQTQQIIAPFIRSEVSIPQNPQDDNNSVSQGEHEQSKPETAFEKASFPKKVAIVVGIPIVIVGAVVYYVVLAPFALVRWVFGVESKK